MSTETLPRSADSRPTLVRGTHHRRLEKLRALEERRRLVLFAVLLISLMTVSALLIAVTDFHFELATASRLIAWGGVTIILCGLVWKLRRWMKFQTGDAVVAAERAWPDMGQRLRTSNDYQNTPEQVATADQRLVDSLESDTQQRVAARTIEPLGRRWPISILGGLCIVAGIVWLIALVVLPEWRVSTARMLLLPAHYSTVELVPLPESIHQGSALSVRAHVDGRPVKSARLRYRKTGQVSWQEKPLQPASTGPLVGDLLASVPDCQHDLELQVQAGPLTSAIHQVDVRIPLVLQDWKATVQPPSYTGLPASEGKPESLSIPEGSEVNLVARYNRAPSEVEVKQTPGHAKPSVRIKDEAASFSLIAAKETMNLTLEATASDGMSDESSLQIQIVPDQAPRLSFAAPQENSESIPTAELHFVPEAIDDYGVATVGIRYRVDDGEEQTLWEASFKQRSDAVTETIRLPLEELDLTFPQAITYYAYAIDNRADQPQRVTSGLRFVDIRPFSREYELRESECSGNCQGECLSLEKLIKQQREILGRTFVAAQQSKAPGDAGTRLADQQQELQTRTEQLAAALEAKVGPMPTLESTIHWMSEAVDHLQQQVISDGQIDQERALADLVATRQNLRKILKQCNSQSQACRSVDRQQMDKLRKPESKQDQQQQKDEQQLSQLREELQRLAKKQDSFCQSARACSRASASSASASSDPATQPSPSRGELSKQQQQSAADASEIQRQLADEKFGPLAPQRTQAAANAIKQSGELFADGGNDEEAIERAEQAADTLKQLSEHLGERHSPDFSEKLGATRRRAEQLADQQRSLSRSSGGREDPSAMDNSVGSQGESKQRELAARTEELADTFDQLLADSTSQQWQIQQALTRQATANPPRQAAVEMRNAAERLQRGERDSAAQSGLAASKTLQRLAKGLQLVEKILGPARLDQLTKAEEAISSQLEAAGRADSAAERAMVQAQSRELAGSIRQFARGDVELTEATRTLSRLADSANDNSFWHPLGDAAKSPRLESSAYTLSGGLRQVQGILQRRIQEAILAGVEQDPNGRIPAAYTEMVDEYYRVLSEDLD